MYLSDFIDRLSDLTPFAGEVKLLSESLIVNLPGSSSSPQLQKLKNGGILIVDDDEEDQVFLKECLSEIGLTEKIHFEDDGPHALEFLQDIDRLPSLIILDLNMPKMNGINLLEKIRQKYDIPVVMHTTDCSDQVLSQAKEKGAIECLKKASSHEEGLSVAKSIQKLMKKES